MADWLRNIVFGLVFYGVSVPIVLGAPVAALFGTPFLRRYCMGWTGYGVWCARVILGIHIRVEGEMVAGPALYAAKHESMFETMALANYLGTPAVVMKQELGQIPAWGWAARGYGAVIVNREASAKALRRMMTEAQGALAEGRSILIFPEGTRVGVGETPPLRSGFAGLYRVLKLPVVPVALDSGRVWPRKGLKRPGVVTMRFFPPIPPGLPREQVEDDTHAAINALQNPEA
ncbi:1-acyl-sn-glycerol-3-phosphate acyltransferase [Sphingomonas sp. MG17]|uniref:1-acyl-sn-glycerol-3-phosphate acyltransferase n=1 Tax=Sphingomonas tagetis TaxID=2949092 RepID=A0A9X2HES9_9SPHN|nr:lysophospholipid acyltransferase family protein [Sphingomonas tagetis]MCP3729518.1 1-acyl-sn-glycerol-3-phosphate acyltransferase [Sphingomonas tagetis]